MIDEIFEVIFDIVLEFIPDVVLRAILLLAGFVATTIGVLLLGESPLLGAGVAVVGAAAMVAAVFFWGR